MSPPDADSRLVVGAHPVRELLRAGHDLREVLLARGDGSGTVGDVRSRAGRAGIPVREVDRGRIDAISPDVAHQGVAAWAPPFPYRSLRDVLTELGDAPAPPLVVALDHLTDPRNVGAIARTAEAAGADALLVPAHRAAPVTTVVERAAAAALAHLPVVRETNLATALRTCRDAGLWIIGLAGDGEVGLWDCPLLTEPLVVVVGEEGEGLARLSQVICDQLVALPLAGQVESLNAGVAAAVALYEVRRRRDT